MAKKQGLQKSPVLNSEGIDENLNINEIREKCIEALSRSDFRTCSIYFKEYIELIMFYLLHNEMFYGNFIIRMERQIRYDFNAPAGVSIKKGGFILALNPILLLRFKHSEVRGILKHEVLHLMHFHLLRSKENNNRFEQNMENISMDLAINQFIPEIPHGCVTFDNFCHTYGLDSYRVDRKAPYEYYLELLQNSKKYKEESKKYNQMMKDLQDIIDQINQSMSGQKPGSKNGSGQGQAGMIPGKGQSGNGQGAGGSSGNNNGQNGISPMDINDLIDKILGEKYPIDHSMWKESDSSDVQEMKEIVKQLVNDVVKTCGNVPGELQELINKINQPPIIKWQDELKKMVGSVRVPYKKTMLRRSRRQQERYDVKGRISDRKIKITVAIDTSGSMGEKELEFVFNEIFNILKLQKFELTIIECDMVVGRVYKAKNIKEVNMKVTGRGGTSFTPVFQYLYEKVYGTSDYPDLLIYFTDGYGEGHIDEQFKPRGMVQIMWVLTGRSKELSVDNPWTSRVKELKMHGDREW